MRKTFKVTIVVDAEKIEDIAEALHFDGDIVADHDILDTSEVSACEKCSNRFGGVVGVWVSEGKLVCLPCAAAGLKKAVA